MLLNKGRSVKEIFNDANGNLINLYRVVRQQPEELMRQLTYVPNSKADFILTKEQIKLGQYHDPVQWAADYYQVINEKYKGEALLQKTFTVDYLTKEVRKNNSEVPSVPVRNSHEAIIEPEVFDKVQELLAEYSKRRAKVRTNHPFAGKIICGDCGEFYGHKVWRLRSTGERYNVWYCNHKYDGDEPCDSPRLRETEIKAAFEKMLQNCGDLNPIYTDEQWDELVQSVRVYKGNHLIFTLTSGEIVKITL